MHSSAKIASFTCVHHFSQRSVGSIDEFPKNDQLQTELLGILLTVRCRRILLTIHACCTRKNCVDSRGEPIGLLDYAESWSESGILNFRVLAEKTLC